MALGKPLKYQPLTDYLAAQPAETTTVTLPFPELEAVGLSGAENVSPAVVPYLARMRKLKAVSLPPRADTVDVRLEDGRTERLRLISRVILRCKCAGIPVTRRGRILPLSVTNFFNRSGFL